MLRPFFVVVFIFNISNISCFICGGRRTTPNQDEEKASKLNPSPCLLKIIKKYPYKILLHPKTSLEALF